MAIELQTCIRSFIVELPVLPTLELTTSCKDQVPFSVRSPIIHHFSLLMITFPHQMNQVKIQTRKLMKNSFEPHLSALQLGSS